MTAQTVLNYRPKVPRAREAKRRRRKGDYTPSGPRVPTVTPDSPAGKLIALIRRLRAEIVRRMGADLRKLPNLRDPILEKLSKSYQHLNEWVNALPATEPTSSLGAAPPTSALNSPRWWESTSSTAPVLPTGGRSLDEALAQDRHGTPLVFHWADHGLDGAVRDFFSDGGGAAHSADPRCDPFCATES